MTEPITIEIAPGELLDKISILEIKSARIGDPAKRANILRDLDLLAAARDRAIPGDAETARLYAELKAVNICLWEIEDAIREEERKKTFGTHFVELARSVYRENDRRAALKREINLRLGPGLVEEKSYAAYD